MYIDSFKEYHSIKTSLYSRKPKHLSASSSPGAVHFKNGARNVDIQLPTYTLFKHELETLAQQRYAAMLKLAAVNNAVIYAGNPSHDLLENYKRLEEKVQELDTRIERTSQMLNEKRRQVYSKLVEATQAFETVSASQKDLFEDSMLPYDDASIQRRAMEVYLKARLNHQGEQKKLAIKEADIQLRAPMFMTTKEASVTVTQGETAKKKKAKELVADEGKADEEPKDEAPVINLPAAKGKHSKAAKKNLADDLIENIDFNFKTLEECKSAKRTAKHYMNKDDILHVIQRKPDVLARMPQGYKGLNKNDLCEAVFVVDKADA